MCSESPAVWCVVNAGIASDLAEPPSSVHRYNGARGTLGLPLPATAAGPVVHGATGTTGPFAGLAARWETAESVVAWGPKKTWSGVGSRHEWLVRPQDAAPPARETTVQPYSEALATPEANVRQHKGTGPGKAAECRHSAVPARSSREYRQHPLVGERARPPTIAGSRTPQQQRSAGFRLGISPPC